MMMTKRVIGMILFKNSIFSQCYYVQLQPLSATSAFVVYKWNSSNAGISNESKSDLKMQWYWRTKGANY